MNRKKVIVSSLLFGNVDATINFLGNLNHIINHSKSNDYFDIKVVIRNNYPKELVDDSKIRDEISRINQSSTIKFFYFAEHDNKGFGGGHNKTYNEYQSDIFVLVNNDIAFMDGKWFLDSLLMFENIKIGLVGPLNAPRSLESINGGGHEWSGDEPSLYAEGSILFCSKRMVDDIGLLSGDYEFAYFEDADLSLRARQAGYEVRYVHVPHEHNRSLSANTLPRTALRSLYEHNKAAFFKNWNEALKKQSLSSSIGFELVSDGIGDVIAAAPHVYSYIDEHKNHIREFEIAIKNNSLRFLFDWIPNVIINISNSLSYDNDHYDAVFTLKGFPYQLPFNLHSLLSAYISPINNNNIFINKLKDITDSMDLPEELKGRKYIVVHAERSRENWEGRFFGLTDVLKLIKDLPDNVSLAIVGTNIYEEINYPDENLKIIDLRCKTSLQVLFSIISHAIGFIGIDSSPIHIAQLFKVPIFGFFGATLPEFRLANDSDIGWTNPTLDCIGCNHKYLKSDYNFCMRRDERCLELSDDVNIEKNISVFIKRVSAQHEYSSIDENESHANRLQRYFVRLLTYNPVFKHHLFNRLTKNTELSDHFAEMISVIKKSIEIGQRESIHDLKTTNERLLNELADLRRQNFCTGNRVSGRIESKGTSDTLIYGPYIPLSPGRYKIQIHGKLSSIGEYIYADLCYDKGASVVISIPINEINANGIIVEFLSEINRFITDAEVRLHVSNTTDCYVTSVSINKIGSFLT